MNDFTRQIDRELAAKYGHEAVAIGESEQYQVASGQTIDISRQLATAMSGTMSYQPDAPLDMKRRGHHDTSILVTNETSLSAAKGLIDAGCNTVVLNFASATSPGGGFLGGARAQEEYLARSSCLYQCIRDNPMYAFHRRNYDPLYSDYAIYSPNVPVIRDDGGVLIDRPYPVGIITCAAVNANEVEDDRRSMILPAMARRIGRVLAIGLSHGHDAIVLGAWGCGAFGNAGNEIARLFREALDKDFRGAYKRVVFAIVDWSAERRFIGPFERMFPSA